MDIACDGQLVEVVIGRGLHHQTEHLDGQLVEQWVLIHHLDGGHPQTPDIVRSQQHFLLSIQSTLLMTEQFRWPPMDGTGCRHSAPVIQSINSRSKVCQFTDSATAQQDVPCLDIAVEYQLRMQIIC